MTSAVPTTTELLDEIERLLPTAISPVLQGSPDGSDLYEYYLASLLIDSASPLGASVTFEDSRGAVATALKFRRSPGAIYSAGRFTHALIEMDHVVLEVHLGIWATGKSKVPSEYDVAVLHRSEGVQCRSDQRDARSARVEIGAEAKFFTGRLGLNVARSFVGLARDSSAKQGLALITNNVFSDLAGKFAQHHRGKGTWREQVTPGSDRVEELTGYLTDILRKARPLR
jgi:hypothetical protein